MQMHLTVRELALFGYIIAKGNLDSAPKVPDGGDLLGEGFFCVLQLQPQNTFFLGYNYETTGISSAEPRGPAPYNHHSGR